MATVMGPSQPQHAGKFRSKSTRPSSTGPSSSARSFDPFYGHEDLAGLCARYVTHLFQCPVMPPNNSNTQHKLPYFIAYALNRTKLHTSVAYSALVLLSRLKARFPSAKGSSGHRLFISAFMISSKVMCDDTYSNKSWAIVAQNLFALREVNQMEHEMVNYLDFELNVDSYTLSVFEAALKRDFGVNASQPYPRYPLDMISKRARESRSPSAPPSRAGLSIDTACATPSSVQSAIEEPVPSTPDATYSNSTSPATTPSPETPLGYVNMDVTVEADDYDLCIRPTCRPSKSQFSQARPAIW